MNFDFQGEPFANLDLLIEHAARQGLKDPNAMQLATLGEEGQPSVRTVLYKGLLREGLSFYTNYESRKSKELLSHDKAAVCFFWAPLEIQVRAEGQIKKLTTAESDAYYNSRPRLSQIGAWASEQSTRIPNLNFLEERVKFFEKKYEGQTIPRPPHWGGFHLLPHTFEFWFGRQGRLHERYCYKKIDSSWDRYMLSP